MLTTAAWVLWFARPGLAAWFTADDVMNLQALHGLWDRPGWLTAWDLVNPFGGRYRPVGGIFYRVSWHLFGLNPLPYRIACFLFLLAGLGLAWRLIRRHAESWPASVAGMLVMAFHPAMVDLYFNSGTVYDLLAAIFYLLAIWRAPRAGAWEAAAWTWLALQSKEMAATLPLVLFLYLWLVLGRIRWTPVMASAGVVALLLPFKLWSGQGLAANALYRPVLEAPFVLAQYAKYHFELFHLPWQTAPGWLLSFWLLLAVVALRWKQPVLLFACCFWITSLLPVCVVPARSMFVLHLPLTALALYVAVLLDRTRLAAVQWCSLGFLGLLMAVTYVHESPRAFASSQAASRENRELVEQLKQQQPELPPFAVLYFSEDPYPPGDWILTFLLRLAYLDPSLRALRAADGIGAPPRNAYRASYRDLRFQIHPPEAIPSVFEPLKITPSQVQPGEAYEVQAATLRGVKIDVEFRVHDAAGEHPGQVDSWCTLDQKGRARVVTPSAQQPGAVQIRRVRPSGGAWLESCGGLRVVRQ
jgi:hypothetical protein